MSPNLPQSGPFQMVDVPDVLNMVEGVSVYACMYVCIHM